MLNTTQISSPSCLNPAVSSPTPYYPDECSLPEHFNFPRTWIGFHSSFEQKSTLKLKYPNQPLPRLDFSLFHQPFFIQNVMNTIRGAIFSISQWNLSLLPVANAQQIDSTDARNRSLNAIRHLIETAESIKYNLTSCENNLNQTKNSITDFRKELDQTLAKLNNTQSKLDQALAKLNNTELKLDQTSVKLNETQLYLDQASAKLNDTQSELDQTSKTLNETEFKLYQTLETLNQTQTQLNKAENKINDYGRQLNNSQKIIEENDILLKFCQEAVSNATRTMIG